MISSDVLERTAIKNDRESDNSQRSIEIPSHKIFAFKNEM